jgi:hypothetical protein
MSTTITLAGSSNWAQAFVGFKSLAIGTSQEPVITSGNILLTTILAPPFSWNWNRSSTTITTVAGTQDYSQAVASFGWIEKASYQIPSTTITNTALTAGVATYTATNNFAAGDIVTVTGTTNGSGIFNISKQLIATASGSQFTVLINNPNVGSAGDTGTAIVGTTTEISETLNILGTGSEQGSPAMIAPQTDDNAGNISFRILPIPDRVYTVTVIFQKRIPALMTTTSSTWAPIPDHYSFIYQWGFLALMLAYNYDVRWTQASQKFVSGLLGVAEGLSEEQRNIFQNAWLNTITEQQATSLKTPQGVQSRQV